MHRVVLVWSVIMAMVAVVMVVDPHCSSVIDIFRKVSGDTVVRRREIPIK